MGELFSVLLIVEGERGARRSLRMGNRSAALATGRHGGWEWIPVLRIRSARHELGRLAGLGKGRRALRLSSILRARLEKALSERGAAIGAELALGPIRIDEAAHRVWVREKEVALTALELRLLVMLVSRQGYVQKRTALLREVWGIEGDVATRTIDTYVNRVRMKLGLAGHYIETIRGVGYRARADAK